MNLDAYNPSNTVVPVKASYSGGLWANNRHAKYYEAVREGRVFGASMQAGAALGTALTATAVTFTLYNPSSSGVNLSLLNVSLAFSTALSVAGNSVYALAANLDPSAVIPATNTEIVVRNFKLGGGSAALAKVYSATTLPAAPIVLYTIGSMHVVGGTPVSESAARLQDETDGKVLLIPNTAVTVQGIGSASSGIVSMIWEEIPV